ncbi:hypothetical protein ABEF93_006845 [Exophiala dermatitidis]
MASEDESSSLDTRHDEKEWEAQKENFRRCYIDQNMTKNDAAEYMKKHFNFDATPRQWERKIKQWEFKKYSSRDERLQQIAQTGKTIFDISRPGRRPRSRTDERGNLHPYEDRNLRRFARREVSKSRSRSRSHSFTGGTRPDLRDEQSPGPSNAIVDQTYNLQLSNPTLLHPPASGGFNVAATPASGDQDEPIQLHYLREEKPPGSGEGSDPEILLTVENSDELPSLEFSDVSGQFDLAGGENQYQNFGDSGLSSEGLGVNGLPMSNENAEYPHASSNSAYNYTISHPTMPASGSFNNFSMYENNLAIPPRMLHESSMPDQRIFDPTTQLQETPNAASASIRNNLPTFAIVDTDSHSTTFLPMTEDKTPFPDLATIPASDPEFPVPAAGPLHTDLMPLLDEYTAAVRATALHCFTDQPYGGDLDARLAADLEYPGQVFRARMAVILDNFAKSQQRAFQSMRDTCSKLRQKNTMLEEMVKKGKQFESDMSRPHRASLPAQSSAYGNIYTNDY